jgi:hypothetical protein
MELFQIEKIKMIEKKISIYYLIIGLILLAYGIEQFIGYQLFKIPINISWWISFISILFGLCLIFRSFNLYKKNNK